MLYTCCCISSIDRSDILPLSLGLLRLSFLSRILGNRCILHGVRKLLGLLVDDFFLFCLTLVYALLCCTFLDLLFLVLRLVFFACFCLVWQLFSCFLRVCTLPCNLYGFQCSFH